MAGEDDEAKRLAEQPAPGMKDDGTLNAIEPGQPIPQPVILADDGSELTPDEANSMLADTDEEQEEDFADLDGEDEDE